MRCSVSVALWSTLLCLSPLAGALNILILNSSPYGSPISTAFHQFLETNHRVISVSPLHLMDSSDNEIEVDSTPISEEDLKDSLDEQEFDLRSLLALNVGDSFYGSQKQDRWYVKSSVLGSALFAFDHLLPSHYTDLSSIDFVVIASSGEQIDGLHRQMTNNNFGLMKLAQMRNIPVLNVNSKEETDMVVAGSINEDLDLSNELLVAYLQRIDEFILQLVNTSKYNEHNFHTSRSLDKSVKFKQYADKELANHNPRLLPNGVGLNINLRAEASCLDTNKEFNFLQTRTVGGYNMVPSLNYDAEKGTVKVDMLYSIDKELPRSKNKYLSEMSVDDGDCFITVTPINWLGGDFEQFEFLETPFHQLNGNEGDERPKLVHQAA
ncbi:hypothetical protein OGAPHI_000355 [Ogataea philodendri]|uniref:Survival protein SurE-like phosphatase/nucleotidase domain-containing protein n=1 Tax=Ogataea philodendri TaxID=1378263 RepID=A0A9P8PHK2_9ASCO|nr:uncharacterized protein OGAPHI_000355 [Ogataea philodendri]KAH3671650.1 hypothetical protein OGAPHI_000355 [Ogataea philodendri]